MQKRNFSMRDPIEDNLTFISLSKVTRIIKTGGTSSSKCFIIESGIDSIRLYRPIIEKQYN